MRLTLPRLSRSQSNLTALYERAAGTWQRGMASLGFDAAYSGLAAAAEGSALTRVLDAGCGTGALSRAVLSRSGPAAQLDLLDPSPAMLSQAALTLPASQLWEGVLGDARVPAGAYSHVLCAHVLEHLADPAPHLLWLRDRLAPGGTLVLAVSKPHWCTALIRWRWGNRAYAPSDVTALLRAAGFDAIKVHPFSSGPPSRVSCGYTARRL